MSIRKLKKEDIPYVKDLPPEDWKFNYGQFLNLHFNRKYFYAVVYMHSGRIVGTGNAIIHDKTGWLANIIVLDTHRNKGIGTAITGHLMKYLEKKKCATQLLIATALGEPVYRKLGFKTDSMYRFFRIDQPLNIPNEKMIYTLHKSDLDELLVIDRKILGDDRSYLITRCYQNGLVYKRNNRITGYYLPQMGRGPVIATDNAAGLLLLKIKHSEAGRRTAVPAENLKAIEYLRQNGFEHFNDCARMFIGKRLPWKPEHIFSYSHGYCG